MENIQQAANCQGINTLNKVFRHLQIKSEIEVIMSANQKPMYLTVEQTIDLECMTMNATPEGASAIRDTGDCAVRAVALATSSEYDWVLKDMTSFQHSDASVGVYHEFVGWYLWENFGWDTYEFHDGYYFGEFLLDGFFEGLFDGLNDPSKRNYIRSRYRGVVVTIINDKGEGHAVCVEDNTVLDTPSLWSRDNWRIHRVSIHPRISSRLRERMKEANVTYHKDRYSGRNKVLWIKKWHECLVESK